MVSHCCVLVFVFVFICLLASVCDVFMDLFRLFRTFLPLVPRFGVEIG